MQAITPIHVPPQTQPFDEIGSGEENVSTDSRYCTCGDFLDEPSSCKEFDRRIAASGLFRSFDEVWGYPLQPRLDSEQKLLRIDRVLIPSPKLINSGWKYGAVGVEIKQSGVKLGPVVAQAMDYSRCAFDVAGYGLRVMCQWIFVWPCDHIGHDIGSLMDQHRIGGVYGRGRMNQNDLTFKTASGGLLSVDRAGIFTIKQRKQGNRSGSR